MSITTQELTEVSLDGSGVFDELMRATLLHLKEEYVAGRIRGTEYATVYTESVNVVMAQAVQFLLSKDEAYQRARLVEEQVESEKLTHTKLQAEIGLIEQQTSNLVAEALNIPKQGELLDAQVSKLITENGLVEAQTSNLVAEGLNIPKQGELLDSQVSKINSEIEFTQQQTSNLEAEALNIPKQGELLDAQVCKLNAEYDLIGAQIAKTSAEVNLLTQKRVTEQAQTEEGIIQPESYLGRQVALYIAQKEGFERDAEQKATRIFADAMAVSEGIEQTGLWDDVPNGMTNANMLKAVNKLLDGIKANS